MLLVTTGPRRPARRLTVLALGIAALTTPLIAVPFTGAVHTGAASAATVTQYPEAPDFASENYHDAWDYSNSQDQNTDFTDLVSQKITGGQYTMQVGPGNWFDPVDTVAGSVPYGRDGGLQPVDSTRYQSLSFSMNQPLSGIGAIYWFTCREKTVACTGGMTFPVSAGSHVYDLHLASQSILGSDVPWTSAPEVAVRVQPVVVANGHAPVNVSIDWLRLHAGNTSVDAMPPGNYGSYAVNAEPQPVVDSPNTSQGADLAAVQRGKSWVFTSASNVSGVTETNTKVRSYSSVGMTATNAGPAINDPEVHFPVSAFSGSQYHWLSWDMTYDGGFGLNDAPGGGKMARVLWNVGSTPGIQIGNDMLTYSAANAAEETLDLDRNPLDEDSPNPRVGWAGQTITSVRFDPNEDPSAATWHLKSLHLRADPAATGATVIQYHDAAWVSGTTADVLVGTAAPGGSGYRTIASGVPVTQGENSTTFALGSLPAGSYHVEVVLHHPLGGNALAYSSTPITMKQDTSHDPRGKLDSAAGTTAGVTVRGWAWDPDASGATNVRLYADGKSAGTVATSVARPDVQKAYPAAPANTGWQAALKLSAGTHTICAYGLNVGAGTQNTTLGCTTIAVKADTSHDPVGRLDSLVAGGTSVRATGWGYDPDGAPMTVRFYEGTKSLGSTTTTLARSDVKAAYPAAPTTSGYTAKFTMAKGAHTICAYGINIGTGTTNTTLGCKAVTVG